MEVRTLSYQATKEKFKSDQQEQSYSQNKKGAKVRARKLDSAITIAISSIALKTFLWQELKVLQQVLKKNSKFLREGGFNAAAIVRAPYHNFSSCSDQLRFGWFGYNLFPNN